MNPNINPTGHPLSSMKWSEIPDATPVKDIMEAIGFPEPMIVLKHLSKPTKKGKTRDLSSVIQFMFLTKGKIDKFLEDGFESFSQNSKIRAFMFKNPTYSIKLKNFLNTLKNESIAEIAEKSLVIWVKSLIKEETWNGLMAETPLTLINKLAELFVDEELLNTTIGTYYETLELEDLLNAISLAALGKHFQNKEQIEKEEKKKEEEFAKFLEALMTDSSTE